MVMGNRNTCLSVPMYFVLLFISSNLNTVYYSILEYTELDTFHTYIEELIQMLLSYHIKNVFAIFNFLSVVLWKVQFKQISNLLVLEQEGYGLLLNQTGFCT